LGPAGRLAAALHRPVDLHLRALLLKSLSGLSPGDRLCLALARRLEATVWTADNAWGTSEAVRQIR